MNIHLKLSARKGSQFTNLVMIDSYLLVPLLPYMPSVNPTQSKNPQLIYDIII